MPLLAAARAPEEAASFHRQRGVGGGGAVIAVIASVATSGLWAAAAHLAPRLRPKLRCFPGNNGDDDDDSQTYGSNKAVDSAPTSCDDPTFAGVLADAAAIAASEPALRASVHCDILRHKSLEKALSVILGNKLGGCGGHSEHSWIAVFEEAYATLKYEGSTTPGELARLDLAAVCDRDPACLGPAHALLFLKGFQALQAHRLAHALWRVGRKALALAMQLKVSEVLGVDVHPAACLGGGLLIDHATGVVIGETCVVGRDCTILQGVTLGASGKIKGDRHPKIGRDVLIGAHAVILGCIEIGDGAKVGAGSVVLKPIPPAATAVGVPARVVGRTQEKSAGKTMDCALHMVDAFGEHANSTAGAGAGVAGGFRGKEELTHRGLLIYISIFVHSQSYVNTRRRSSVVPHCFYKALVFIHNKQNPSHLSPPPNQFYRVVHPTPRV